MRNKSWTLSWLATYPYGDYLFASFSLITFGYLVFFPEAPPRCGRHEIHSNITLKRNILPAGNHEIWNLINLIFAVSYLPLLCTYIVTVIRTAVPVPLHVTTVKFIYLFLSVSLQILFGLNFWVTPSCHGAGLDLLFLFILTNIDIKGDWIKTTEKDLRIKRMYTIWYFISIGSLSLLIVITNILSEVYGILEQGQGTVNIFFIILVILSESFFLFQWFNNCTKIK